MADARISTTFTLVDRMSGPMRNMQRMARRLVGVLSVGLAARGVGQLIQSASMIEDAAAAFTPLMGGVERATALVNRLNETAATTPFQFEQISDVAKQLLPVMNGDIERTVETFRMLGDTAGGNAQRLESITRGYTKAMLQNKVTLESLNMIAEAGVPVFDQLARQLGVSTAQMFDMVSAGEVTTDALTDTFQTMTSEGGIFFSGMAIASETFSGRMSTMKDNIKLTAASIGQALLPTAKSLVDEVIDLAQNVKGWVDANQDLIKQRVEEVVDRIKRTVQALAQAWQSGLIPAILAGVAAFMAIQKTIAVVNAVKGAWAALNAVFIASPIGLIVAGIVALVAGLVLAYRRSERFREIVDRLFQALQPLGQFVGDVLLTQLEGLIAAVGWLWNALKPFAQWLGNVLLQAFENIVASIERWVSLFQALKESNVGQAMGRLFDGDPSTRMFGRNENVIRSQETSESRSTLGFDFSGLPPGVTPQLSGNAPGIRTDLGRSGGL